MTDTIDERPDIPLGLTYDQHGNELTLKDNNGNWIEYTRDEHGRELAYKDSLGRWYECTFDESGNPLTYKDKSGLYAVLANCGVYELMYHTKRGVYRAGCRNFNREQALAHWGDPKRTDKRAKLFYEVILAHTATEN